MSGARVAHNARQVDASSSTGASGSTSSTSQSPTTVAAPTSAPSSSSGTPLNDTGLYECTSNLNLPFLASLVADYINSTSDTLSANLLFFEFNLHTARPGSAPVEPAPTLLESELPSQTELAGGVFNNFTSPLLYQFSELLTERANLNDSWYSGSASEEPISEYFITADSPGGPLSTPNGWPSEYFVEFKRFKRVLLGWGSVDSQMEGYDFDGDSDFVFPQRYISLSTDVSLDRAGRLESGCLYNAEQLTVAETNSSWAVSVLNTSSSQASGDSLGRLAGNLTSCGITPVLNTTLGNQTADLNALPYIQFVQSTVWNWAPGEPRVIPVQDANSRDDENTQTPFRCALMETSLTRNASRWRAEYCDKRHRTACRIANEPYLWRLSAESVPFSDAEGACEANSSFSVPCTGLENMYLYQHILALPEESRSGLSGDESGVWLNLNSLDVEACWVTTGPNGTCPHSIDEEAIRQRTVLVPVVAALVVLLLTALTMFVKCNKNRWNSRKRIRGEGGWDYEGVPS